MSLLFFSPTFLLDKWKPGKLWPFVSIILTAGGVCWRIWYRYKSDRQNWQNYTNIKNDTPGPGSCMESALRIKPHFPSNCKWKSMGTDKWREHQRERGSLTRGLRFNTKQNEKIAGMKFQLIALVISGFPGTDPLEERRLGLWTDQPNTHLCWVLLSVWPLGYRTIYHMPTNSPWSLQFLTANPSLTQTPSFLAGAVYLSHLIITSLTLRPYCWTFLNWISSCSLPPDY